MSKSNLQKRAPPGPIELEPGKEKQSNKKSLLSIPIRSISPPKSQNELRNSEIVYNSGGKGWGSNNNYQEQDRRETNKGKGFLRNGADFENNYQNPNYIQNNQRNSNDHWGNGPSGPRNDFQPNGYAYANHGAWQNGPTGSFSRGYGPHAQGGFQNNFAQNIERNQFNPSQSSKQFYETPQTNPGTWQMNPGTGSFDSRTAPAHSETRPINSRTGPINLRTEPGPSEAPIGAMTKGTSSPTNKESRTWQGSAENMNEKPSSPNSIKNEQKPNKAESVPMRAIKGAKIPILKEQSLDKFEEYKPLTWEKIQELHKNVLEPEVPSLFEFLNEPEEVPEKNKEASLEERIDSYVKYSVSSVPPETLFIKNIFGSQFNENFNLGSQKAQSDFPQPQIANSYHPECKYRPTMKIQNQNGKERKTPVPFLIPKSLVPPDRPTFNLKEQMIGSERAPLSLLKLLECPVIEEEGVSKETNEIEKEIREKVMRVLEKKEESQQEIEKIVSFGTSDDPRNGNA